MLAPHADDTGGGASGTTTIMNGTALHAALVSLLTELVEGADERGGPFILNSGDAGLLRSLDKLSAADASHSVSGGATIAAHVQHLRDGLSLMNRWAAQGGTPFADPAWDKAWNTSAVDTEQWEQIRNGLREEAHRWLQAAGSPRQLTHAELAGMIGSIAHVAYHLGAIRQISKTARGPRGGTFA
jgi:hypothetical protein